MYVCMYVTLFMYCSASFHGKIAAENRRPFRACAFAVLERGRFASVEIPVAARPCLSSVDCCY